MGDMPRMLPTDAERARKSRMARRTWAVELPGTVTDALVAVRDRDGDASLVATATRLILAAALPAKAGSTPTPGGNCAHRAAA